MATMDIVRCNSQARVSLYRLDKGLPIEARFVFMMLGLVLIPLSVPQWLAVGNLLPLLELSIFAPDDNSKYFLFLLIGLLIKAPLGMSVSCVFVCYRRMLGLSARRNSSLGKYLFRWLWGAVESLVKRQAM